MQYCPECGAALEPGDEFCLNCGASLTEDRSTPVSRKQKKSFPFKVLFIILGIVAVLVAAFLIWFNTPKIKLLRAGVKTINDIRQLDTVDSFIKAYEDGSIEAEADMTEFLNGLAFLDAVEAKANAKIGRDKESCSIYIDAGASVQGMSALDAEMWLSPESLVLRSSALLGKKSYAVDLSELMPNEEISGLSMLIQHILNAEAEKGALKLYNSAFNAGEVYSENFEGTQVIHLTLDSDALARTLSDFCSWGLNQKSMSEYAKDFDPSTIYAFSDMLPADSSVKLRFYINKDMRINRLELGLKDASASLKIEPGNKAPESFTLSAKNSDYEAECTYKIKEDSEDKLSSVMTAEIDGFELANTSVNWNKESGDFEVKYDNEVITPKMTLRFNEKDNIPTIPSDAKKVSLLDSADVDEVAGSLDENVSTLVNELGLFMPFSIKDIVNTSVTGFADTYLSTIKDIGKSGMSANEIKELTESISESVAESVAESVSESISASLAESVEAEAAALAESIAREYAASASSSGGSAAVTPSPIETTPAETEPAKKSIGGTYELQDGAAYGISGSIALTDSGTYSVSVVYNLFINLSDSGKYTMDSNGNLTFTTKLPYQFTAKYDYQDTILLTIPQMGTFTLKRVK